MVLLLLIFIEEAFDAAFRVDELVLAREERVAARANFDLDVFLGGARLERVAAGASDLGLDVNGMNTLFHNTDLCVSRVSHSG